VEFAYDYHQLPLRTFFQPQQQKENTRKYHDERRQHNVYDSRRILRRINQSFHKNQTF
jgi:hypothetical protein